MYRPFVDACEKLLRIPAAPEPPPGDEHTTKIFHAAPNYFKYLWFIWAIKSLVLVLAVIFVLFGIAAAILFNRHHAGTGGVLISVLVIEFVIFGLMVFSRLFSLAMVRLDYEKRWYIVTDRSLRVREGIVNVQEMTVNFANIQNISISQGPIQRWLQIADLKVDTAGGGSIQPHGQHQLHNLHTAFFRGVNNALEIRELIQARLRHLKDSGLGDHEEVKTSITSTGDSRLIEALREVHEETQKLNAALQTA
jgi:membrane protein YdbS with pleckstrin-like domain